MISAPTRRGIMTQLKLQKNRGQHTLTPELLALFTRAVHEVNGTAKPATNTESA